MPNHVHLLFSLTPNVSGRGNPSPTIDSVVGWLKYHATKEINNMSEMKGQKIFQRSFYDHVVRNQVDYDEIYSYIVKNPICWQHDKLYRSEP